FFTLFLFSALAPSELYTLSLHDALPICAAIGLVAIRELKAVHINVRCLKLEQPESAVSDNRNIVSLRIDGDLVIDDDGTRIVCRSEEHTSELQSRFDLVCRLLLEKKKHK